MATSRAKDLADFIAKQSTDDDSVLETGALQLPDGTTAERPTAVQGMIRFNNTLDLAEYYDGVSWKSIDSPPAITSISPTTETDANANIVITGSNFQSGATVKFIGNDGTEYNSPSVTIDSSTQITATTPSTALTVANEPYDVQVTNASGLSGTLADALDAGDAPAWTTASGNILTIYDAARSSVSVTVTATDADSDTITYALASGDTLPTGLSLNSSTGEITGSTSAVGSDTTTTFDIEAQTSNATTTRTFNIVQKAPVVTSYTSVGAFTFSVPSGVSTVDVLVVGGGGGVYQSGSNPTDLGGGGAGGLIYRPQFPVTPGGSVPGSVGAGGQGTKGPGSSIGGNAGPGLQPRAIGDDSTFGTLTAKGGGAGGSGSPVDWSPGGSGGGVGAIVGGAPIASGGVATQPQQPGDSGTYGFGNAGGGSYGSDGGGGGGAGSAGIPFNPSNPSSTDGNGGQGKAYSISGSSVYYAGGGGGGGESVASGQGGQGGGGQGASALHAFPSLPGPGTGGAANRGGGAGGGDNDLSSQMSGGSGIVIVSY